MQWGVRWAGGIRFATASGVNERSGWVAMEVGWRGVESQGQELWRIVMAQSGESECMIFEVSGKELKCADRAEIELSSRGN